MSENEEEVGIEINQEYLIREKLKGSVTTDNY